MEKEPSDEKKGSSQKPPSPNITSDDRQNPPSPTISDSEMLEIFKSNYSTESETEDDSNGDDDSKDEIRKNSFLTTWKVKTFLVTKT